MVNLEYIVFFLGLFFRIFHPSPSRSEIELLRKENQILKRKLGRKLRFNNLDRVFLVAIHKYLPELLEKITIVKPKTVIEWHRRLVSKKWDYSKRRQGRPPIELDLKILIWDMKKANSRWGAGKIVGALKKLGIKIGRETVRSILRDGGFSPTKVDSGPTWLQFLRSQCNRWWACDFFVVETPHLSKEFMFSLSSIVLVVRSLVGLVPETQMPNGLKMLFALHLWGETISLNISYQIEMGYLVTGSVNS